MATKWGAVTADADVSSVTGGLPAGGAANQVLTKNTATDFDTKWAAPATGGASGDTRELQIPTGSYEPIPRAMIAAGCLASSTLGWTSGRFMGMGFTAPHDGTITSLHMWTSTAAASGVSMARFAVYSLDGSDNATLLASSVNDTTLFTTTSAQVSKALSTPATITAGQRYALAILLAATSMPVCVGAQLNGNPAVNAGTYFRRPPRVNFETATTYADLPASMLATDFMTSSSKILHIVTT